MGGEINKMEKVEQVKQLIRDMTEEERKEIKSWSKEWNFHLG